MECVIADTTIGGVAEAVACAEKFKLNNVGVVITVTPCWCYGSETIDMDPHMPKAIWGFNGTERPGAVYLAAALAGHSQLGLPAFSIYGTEVQEANDTSIPEDVKEKQLRFARAGLTVANIRGKSYLSIGAFSMGIAGSIVNQQFFQEYLGMRNEYVDMTEIKRRLDRHIYDQAEVDLALMKYLKAEFMLLLFAIGGFCSILGVIFIDGIMGLYCLILTSVFMSLMFPTIYDIALFGLKEEATLGAAGLVMAIVGGALMPPLQGMIIDQGEVMGIPEVNFSFVLPLICFVVIAIYGYRTWKVLK